MPIRTGVIDRPIQIPTTVSGIDARVAEPGASPLGSGGPIRRQREILILHRLVFPERPLCGENTPDAKYGDDKQHCRTQSHFEAPAVNQRITGLGASVTAFWNLDCSGPV